jgi:hypothetical protein
MFAAVAMLALSMVLCVLGWPDARIGLVVNADLLAAIYRS